MTVKTTDKIGAGLVQVILMLRQIKAMEIVLAEHFGAEHPLVKEVQQMWTLGNDGFVSFCEGLGAEGILDIGDELPPNVPRTMQ